MSEQIKPKGRAEDFTAVASTPVKKVVDISDARVTPVRREFISDDEPAAKEVLNTPEEADSVIYVPPRHAGVVEAHADDSVPQVLKRGPNLFD